jgi:hypothetical protein
MILVGGVADQRITYGTAFTGTATFFCEVRDGDVVTQANRRLIRNVFLNKNTMASCLGSKTVVELLLPECSTGITEHDQNIMVKILHADMSVLPTGDASSTLMNTV